MVSVLFPSKSVIQGGDSARQNSPVQHASTIDSSGSVVQGSGPFDQNPDETTPFNSQSLTIARGSHSKSRSCSPNHARSVKRQPGNQNPPEPSRSQRTPATPREQKPQSGEEEHLPMPLPDGEDEPEECFIIPECENIDGQPTEAYCCPYAQRIGYDDRYAPTRTGCTDCSYRFHLFVRSVLPDTRIGSHDMKVKLTGRHTNLCTVSLSNFLCERQNNWMGVFCCLPGYTVRTGCFF